MKMRVLVRVQVEMTKVIEVDADEEGNWSVDAKPILEEIKQTVESGGWNAFVDPDFEAEEMPQQPGRPR